MYDLALITPTPIRELTRVGDANDGGYVIPDVCLATTDTLVSLGLAFNWSFDDAFVKASQASVIGVDGSLTRWGFVRRSIQKSRHALGYLLTLNIAKAKLRFARSADIMRWGNTFFRSAGDGRSRMYKRFVSRKVGPEFITIDALLSDRARKELSVFVKMDIEGSEYEVLHELRAHAATINGLVIEFHELGARGDEFSAGITRCWNGSRSCTCTRTTSAA